MKQFIGTMPTMVVAQKMVVNTTVHTEAKPLIIFLTNYNPNYNIITNWLIYNWYNNQVTSSNIHSQ